MNGQIEFTANFLVLIRLQCEELFVNKVLCDLRSTAKKSIYWSWDFHASLDYDSEIMLGLTPSKERPIELFRDLEEEFGL